MSDMTRSMSAYSARPSAKKSKIKLHDQYLDPIANRELGERLFDQAMEQKQNRAVLAESEVPKAA